MTDNSAFILDAAPILAEALTLRQALIDGDLREARFRVRAIVMQASLARFSAVTAAARAVGKLLRRPTALSLVDLDAAMSALAAAIDTAALKGS